jgi:glycosyltransferase involved in cell wall biosynthesis
MHERLVKVAFVATVFRHFEAFHLPFIEWLISIGCEVHAYAKSDHGMAGVSQAGVICHHIPFERSPFSLQNLRAGSQLVHSFREEQFHIVHAHTPMGSVVGRIAAHLAHVPVVLYTAHGFHFYGGAPISNWMMYYPVERFLSRFTDHLITINPEDYERVQQFKVRSKRWYVPGVGVNAQEYTPHALNSGTDAIRTELGIRMDDFVILCVAEFTRNKNHVQLIQSMVELVEEYDTVHCLMVGDGSCAEELRQLVLKRGLSEHVQFLGFRRDVPSLLHASDAVALMSKREGLPKALLEAMCAGKPVVATNTRGIRDLIKHEQNGLLVPVNDVRSTTHAFLRLIQDVDLRHQLGVASHRMSFPYHIDNVMICMQEIYTFALTGQTAFPPITSQITAR